MTEEDEMKAAIQAVIQSMMDKVMENVLINDPFLVDKHHAKKPLYAALVPDEIFKGSHFERRFVTPFGTVWERLAAVAASYGLGYGATSYKITGNIREGRLIRINEVLNNLEHRPKKSTLKPNWNNELAYIIAGNGSEIPVTVICDLYVEDTQTNKKYSFELKAPLPNSDQTKVSKEKIFKLYAMDPCPIDKAFFALPYNPYGIARDEYVWPFPSRWFDMKNDPVVLIGNDFWEMIGGAGTYQSFISAINEIGLYYKERIYREFLGIEPPKGFDFHQLS